jgi:hypothetical protein
MNFFAMLAVAFIVLKLTDVVAWSWIWVLSPMWMPAAIILGLGVLYVVFGIGEGAINALKQDSTLDGDEIRPRGTRIRGRKYETF